MLEAGVDFNKFFFKVMMGHMGQQQQQQPPQQQQQHMQPPQQQSPSQVNPNNSYLQQQQQQVTTNKLILFWLSLGIFYSSLKALDFVVEIITVTSLISMEQQ